MFNNKFSDIDQDIVRAYMYASHEEGMRGFITHHANMDCASYGTAVEEYCEEVPVPTCDPSDLRKLLRIKEPHRLSKWLRMSFVSCEGYQIDFGQL